MGVRCVKNPRLVLSLLSNMFLHIFTSFGAYLLWNAPAIQCFSIKAYFWLSRENTFCASRHCKNFDQQNTLLLNKAKILKPWTPCLLQLPSYQWVNFSPIFLSKSSQLMVWIQDIVVKRSLLNFRSVGLDNLDLLSRAMQAPRVF